MIEPRVSTDPPDWLDELQLRVRPRAHSMGLYRLDEERWLDVDQHRSVELELKAALLESRHPDVFAVHGDITAEASELGELIVANLEHNHGMIVQPDPDLHPLEATARLVQEDLTILEPTDQGHVLVGGAVCFPSGWHLREKLGHPLAHVHGPIPKYAEELSGKVDTFFNRLTPEVLWYRRNWFLYDNQALFQPDDPSHDHDISADQAGEQIVIRSERETIRKLPRTGAVVFTIRTQQAALSSLGERTDIARAMFTYLTESPSVVKVLKGVEAYHEPVLAYLDGISSPA